MMTTKHFKEMLKDPKFSEEVIYSLSREVRGRVGGPGVCFVGECMPYSGVRVCMGMRAVCGTGIQRDGLEKPAAKRVRSLLRRTPVGRTRRDHGGRLRTLRPL